jgi:hypothetical protein
MSELAAFLDRSWDWLAGAPRRGVLASVAGGAAEARLVMLRRVDRTRGVVTVHSDAATPKVTEIAASPGGSLLCWDPAVQVQIRLRLRLSARPGTPAEWAAVPAASRENYGTVPVPGTPIGGPGAYRRQPDPARFAVISGLIEAIDLVDLAAAPHRRALYRRAEDWAGCWLAP